MSKCDANDIIREHGSDALRDAFDCSIKFDGGDKAGMPQMPPLLSMRDFLKDFVPPEYLIDGILQRRFLYALTGQTGHAKTAIALLIAQLVGAREAGAMLGTHLVEQGRVVYFAGENPDDVRMRLIGAKADLDARISFIAGVFDIGAMQDRLASEIERFGKVDLIVVDTSAAYFLGNEELSNTQMGAHARMLRRLTAMPGGPCVLVLCHPIKHVTEPSQLLPRGGGAFLNEMDGNLTAWKVDELVELHHNKLRGPGFEPMTFRIERIASTDLTDSKGRLIPTVKAVVISEHEEAAEKQDARDDENKLLVALVANPDHSIADLARDCGWISQGTGEPYKSKVHRTLEKLEASKPKLVAKKRDRWMPTEEGEKSARKNEPAKHELRPIKGQGLQDVACAYCGKQYGEVFKFRDGRVKGGQAEALHEGCAEVWFKAELPRAK
jgi:AAA domain